MMEPIGFLIRDGVLKYRSANQGEIDKLDRGERNAKLS